VEETWFNRFGQKIRFDLNGRTIERVVTDGRNRITYDAAGNATYEERDEWGNVTKIVYPDGATKTYQYEPGTSNLIRETNERGVVTEYGYDARGSRIHMVEAVGTPAERTTQWEYHPDGRLHIERRVGDAVTEEAVTTWEYDDARSQEIITDPEGNVTRLTYDDFGNATARQDGRGYVWTYGYDDEGRLTSGTDPLGNTRTYEYDERGNRIQETDPLDNVTQYAYDTNNNLVSVTDALGAVTTYVYDRAGNRVEQIDPEGKRTWFEYDLDGRLVKTIDGAGNEVVMEYGDGSEGSCLSCPSGGTGDLPSRVNYHTYSKEFGYDPRARVLEEVDVSTETVPRVVSYAYDAAGNRSSTTDPLGRVTRYSYDELNRLVRVADPLGHDTLFTYDGRDNLIALTDANGNTTRFEYDRRGLLTRRVQPLGDANTYVYDEAGNWIEGTDPKGQRTAAEYDAAGRLTALRYFDSAEAVTSVRTVAYRYDRVGNIVGYDAGVTSGEYAYDDCHRMTSEFLHYGSFGVQQKYSYYRNGLRKSYTAPDGRTYDYTYDENSRLQTFRIPGQGPVTYAHGWAGVTSIAYPGGTMREYAYDSLGQVSRMSARDSEGKALMEQEYEYLGNGRLSRKVTEHGTYEYRYDDLDQVIYASSPFGEPLGYAYDPAGNRLWSSDVQGTWTYNANNELLAQGENATFWYDANGNTLEKEEQGRITLYAYDTQNRLIRVEPQDPLPGDTKVTFEYDHQWRRVQKEVHTYSDPGGWSLTSDTRFAYDGWNLTGELDSNGGLVKSYAWGVDVSDTLQGAGGIGGLLAATEGTSAHFYLYDWNGNVGKLVNSEDGAIVAQYQYEPYGITTLADGPIVLENTFMFSTKAHDTEENLAYYGYRYYSLSVGRWLTRDPIGLAGGINLYGFVENNPIGRIDPLGLKSLPGKLLSEIISQLVQGIPQSTIEGLTGSVCASRYCKKKISAKTWMKALSECMTIFYQANIPTGIPPFTSSADLVSGCADVCFQATNSAHFKKICVPCSNVP
jgi:RHS repeat-associated protein